MMVNLEGVDIPLGMISQYLPKQFERIQSGELSAIPHQLIMDKIYDVFARLSLRLCGIRTVYD